MAFAQASSVSLDQCWTAPAHEPPSDSPPISLRGWTPDLLHPIDSQSPTLTASLRVTFCRRCSVGGQHRGDTTQPGAYGDVPRRGGGVAGCCVVLHVRWLARLAPRASCCGGREPPVMLLVIPPGATDVMECVSVPASVHQPLALDQAATRERALGRIPTRALAASQARRPTMRPMARATRSPSRKWMPP
jgi:hypothetical protein